MDAIFEYLPLIIGAIYYIFVKNRKKKEEIPNGIPPTSPQKQKKERTSLEEILKELSGQNKPVGNRPIQKTPKQKAPAVVPEIKSSETFKRKANIPSVLVKNVEEIESEVNFDLKEAIVYQTILNRPEY